MRIEETGILGCVIVVADRREDLRGWFMKTFHDADFAAAGLRTDWREQYVSSSVGGVVRGMHFQSPPHDHAKRVTCLTGAVLDVMVDLRRGSPTFGEHCAVPLAQGDGRSVYLPSGIAHGFLARRDSLMLYDVTSVYAPANDGGIAWDSFGFDWGVDDPIVSDRDRALPALDRFASPFVFADTA